MPGIPIYNETEYALTPEISQQITREAQEYFGESIRAIRVQYGIERHAYNARTGEVRYAFSPSDYGLIDTTTAFPETYFQREDIPSIDDDETEAALATTSFEDSATDDDDEEEEEPRETSLESLEEDEFDDEEEEEAGFLDLEDQFEENDDDDNGFVFDEDDFN